MTRRILHRDESEELESALDDLDRLEIAGRGTDRDGQDPETTTGHRRQFEQCPFVCATSPGAQREHRIGRPLHEHLSVDDDRHASTPRIERESAHRARVVGRHLDAAPSGERIERCFHRITMRDPFTVSENGSSRTATRRHG